MLATAPVFYKIVVTEKLSRCVSQGTYPSEKTVVQRYVPPVPEPNLYPHGMRLLENRCAAFQSLEAFKSLIVRPSSDCYAVLTENVYSLKLRLTLRARL